MRLTVATKLLGLNFPSIADQLSGDGQLSGKFDVTKRAAVDQLHGFTPDYVNGLAYEACTANRPIATAQLYIRPEQAGRQARTGILYPDVSTTKEFGDFK